MIRPDVNNALFKNRACVEACVHAHNGDAGGFVSSQDGCSHRRCPTVPRQQRCMNVQAAIFWKLQQGGVEQLPVRRHHNQVRCPVDYLCMRSCVAQAYGRNDRQAKTLCFQLYRTCGRPAPAPCGAVGLGNDARNRPLFKQFLQGGHCKLRCSHEYNAHVWILAFGSAKIRDCYV